MDLNVGHSFSVLHQQNMAAGTIQEKLCVLSTLMVLSQGTFSGHRDKDPLLNIQHVDQSRAVKKGFKYMFQKLADKSAGRLDYTVPGGDRPSLTH